MATLRIKDSDGTWTKVPILGSYKAVEEAQNAASEAQNAASVATTKADRAAELVEEAEETVLTSNVHFFKTVTELKATELGVGSVVTLLGYNTFNDGGANTYVIREAKSTETSDEAANLIKLNSGLIAELVQDYKVKNDGYHVPYHNGDGVINEILDCAMSYLKKFNDGTLNYGHTYCAYNDAYPPTETTKNIDCVTFCQLLTNGVPYEMSQYVMLDKNYPKYDWGYDWNDFYVGRKGYEYLANRGRMLANDMLSYCENKGWAFHIADDFSNLEAGDLLFYPSDDHADDKNYYKNVGHVAMFLWKNGAGECVLIDSQSSNSVIVISARVASNVSNYIMAARVPLGVKKKNVKNLFYDEKKAVNKTYTNQKVSNAGTYHISNALEPYKFYTFVCSLEQDKTQNDGESKQSIALSFSSGSAWERWKKKKTVQDNLYVSHFFVNADGVLVNTAGINTSTTDKKSITVILYNVDASGSFISGGATQVNTIVNYIGLYEGLINPVAERIHYEIDYEGIDTPIPYKAISIYDLNDSNVMSTLDSLHTNAPNYSEYSCVVRCVDVTSSGNAQLAGKVWYVKGFRYMSASYGWQIFIPYSSNTTSLMRKKSSSSWGSIAQFS